MRQALAQACTQCDASSAAANDDLCTVVSLEARSTMEGKIQSHRSAAPLHLEQVLGTGSGATQNGRSPLWKSACLHGLGHINPLCQGGRMQAI